MTYSTNSARIADLAKKLREIEDELHRCDRNAAGHKGLVNGSWRTPLVRSVLDQAADDMEQISEEWADERI